MPKWRTKVICRVALLAAMYYLLNLVEIRAPGNLHITFDRLPMVVSALAFGPMEAVLVAMFGELLNQLLGTYGLTATTLLWVLPPMLQAALIGGAASRMQAAGKRLESRPVTCYAVCVLAAVITTAANTAVIWLDSVIYGYYAFAVVFGSAAVRLVTGVAAAVLVTTAAMPLVALLRRQKHLAA